jgi:hypothetical protein
MEELKKNLIKLCNESGLPLEAVVFVIKDLYRDACDSLEQARKAQHSQAVMPPSATGVKEPEIVNAED